MAAKAKKRRIAPQPLAAEDLPAGVVPRSSHLQSVLPSGEQSAASKHSGRRIYVDINKADYHVRWDILCKKDGVQAKRDSTQSKKVPDVMNGPLSRLELAYMQEDDTDGSGEEAAQAEGGAAPENGAADAADGEANESADEPEGDDDRQGEMDTDDKLGYEVPKPNDMDYKDAFIDDSYVEALHSGDRRRTKHQGFFITRGQIEKLEEEVAVPKSHKRKRPAPASKAKRGKTNAGTPAVATSPPPSSPLGSPAPGSQPKLPKKPLTAAQLALMAGVAAAGGDGGQEGTPPLASPVQGSPAPRTTGSPANKKKAPIRRSVGPEAMSEHARAEVAQLLRALESVPVVPHSGSGALRLPKGVNEAVRVFAWATAAEARVSKDAKDAMLDAILPGLERHGSNRKSLTTKLAGIRRDQQKELVSSMESLKKVIQQQLDKRGSAASLKAAGLDSAFTFEEETDQALLRVLDMAVLASGQDGQLPEHFVGELLELWPDGAGMTEGRLRGQLRRLKEGVCEPA